MKKKVGTIIFFMLISSVMFAAPEDKSDSWYEILGTLVAAVATIITIAITLSQIKTSRPTSEKLKLEIESLKLDIEEKRLKLKKPISVDEDQEEKLQQYSTKKLSLNYTSARIFSRFSIGVLAILLPIILVLGSILFGGLNGVLNSMGDYYYTNMRDIYVGTHLVIAVILFSYLGYDRRDYVISKLQGVFCLLIGFCPTGTNSILNIIHFTAFSLFLVSHAYFSIFLFTKTGGRITTKKMMRNKIFRICGYIILVCLLLLLSYSFVSFNVLPAIKNFKLIFYTESIAFWAFGLSWLLKDEIIFKD